MIEPDGLAHVGLGTADHSQGVRTLTDCLHGVSNPSVSRSCVSDVRSAHVGRGLTKKVKGELRKKAKIIGRCAKIRGL